VLGTRPTRRRSPGFVLVICLFCVATMTSNPWEAIPADSGSKSLITCDIQKGPCTKQLAGMTLTLDILPKPVTALKDLTFTLKVSGKSLSANPFIDLGMPGMDMGPNRVELRRVKDNVFEGQGVIVRCPSGRRTWAATVTLPQTGKVEFVFDVIH
jgi:hypothetical protein